MKKLIAEAMASKSFFQAYETLRTKPLSPEELEDLAALSREELENLMAICQITTYNDCPIVALTDNEIRMAYCAWRGHEINRLREPAKKATRYLKRIMEVVKSYTERGYFT